MRRWYTKEEIQFVKKNIKGRSYAEMRILFNKQFRLRLTKKQFDTLMYKHKIRNGIPSSHYTKGKKHKGWNAKPIGYERIQMGYVWVKVTNKKYAGTKNWKPKQVAVWEKEHGKVPKGHAVIFADGNNRNFNLNNLLMISRGHLGILNKCGLISNQKELTVAGIQIADIKIAIYQHKLKLKKKGKKKKEMRKLRPMLKLRKRKKKTHKYNKSDATDEKIIKLRQMINDENYLNVAINTIADNFTKGLHIEGVNK